MVNYDITVSNVPDWATVKIKYIDSSDNFREIGWLGITIDPEGITYSGVGWIVNNGVLESSETFNDCGCYIGNGYTGTGTIAVYINNVEHWSKPITLIE